MRFNLASSRSVVCCSTRCIIPKYREEQPAAVTHSNRHTCPQGPFRSSRCSNSQVSAPISRSVCGPFDRRGSEIKADNTKKLQRTHPRLESQSQPRLCTSFICMTLKRRKEGQSLFLQILADARHPPARLNSFLMGTGTPPPSSESTFFFFDTCTVLLSSTRGVRVCW